MTSIIYCMRIIAYRVLYYHLYTTERSLIINHCSLVTANRGFGLFERMDSNGFYVYAIYIEPTAPFIIHRISVFV